MATQPAEQTVASTDLPRTLSATVDADFWWVVNLPSNASMVTVDMHNTSGDVLMVWSFDQTLSNNDAIPDWPGITDGTIHNLAGAGMTSEYGDSYHMIPLPAAHDTLTRPFQIAIGILSADDIISIMVS